MQGLFAVDDTISAAGENSVSVAFFDRGELKGNRFIQVAK
jgi:hypothetical protein